MPMYPPFPISVDVNPAIVSSLGAGFIMMLKRSAGKLAYMATTSIPALANTTSTGTSRQNSTMLFFYYLVKSGALESAFSLHSEFGGGLKSNKENNKPTFDLAKYSSVSNNFNAMELNDGRSSIDRLRETLSNEKKKKDKLKLEEEEAKNMKMIEKLLREKEKFEKMEENEENEIEDNDVKALILIVVLFVITLVFIIIFQYFEKSN